MKEIEKMMDILGVTNQAGISSKLGIPESTISAWISCLEKHNSMDTAFAGFY